MPGGVFYKSVAADGWLYEDDTVPALSPHNDLLETVGYNGYPFNWGLRFPNLNIPSGAQICFASLGLMSEWGGGTRAPNVRIYGEESAAPSAHAVVSDWQNAVRTSNFLAYQIAYAYREYGWSPDFSNVIQEIVDTVGAVTSLNLLIENQETTGNYQTTYSNAHARLYPLLTVGWSTGGGGGGPAGYPVSRLIGV